MIALRARNVHQALPIGISLLKREGVRQDSRYGVTWEHPEPVTTVYARPSERVVFWDERDANPVFHLFESLWMLSGSNDVEWLAPYNKRIRTFSDDGTSLHGAYGHRWRHQFFDQFPHLIKLLKKDPETRRAVLQMWHAPLDLGTDSKDIPCNTQIYFKIRDGKLRMTVSCRSNDIVWGAYGANAVHFSVLHEYIANKVGVAVGPYYQISDSFHAYEGVWDSLKGLPMGQPCPYETGEVLPARLGAEDDIWDEDLLHFMDDDVLRFKTPFFERVVRPLDKAYRSYRERDFHAAIEHANKCEGPDWRKATVEWLRRRPSFKEA